jgi:ATP-dependent DNA ligase
MLSAAPIPMLATLRLGYLPGQHERYEPKLDGFRGLLTRDRDGHASSTSRNGKDLLRWLPDQTSALSSVDWPPRRASDGSSPRARPPFQRSSIWWRSPAANCWTSPWPSGGSNASYC